MESSTILKSNIADELRIEGINYKGYGIIPKLVMLDTDLTIEAKGIYAYFCSYAGPGNTAFPGRDKIVSDLSINKDSYYKHYNLLISNGYISVEKRSLGGRGVGFQKNIYTLISNPEKASSASDISSISHSSRIAIPDIKAFGYGFIAKAVMTDMRISLKAKSLYAYYCAFTGAGNNACPARDDISHHLNISKNSFTKYNKELIDANYIEVVQRHVNGKMSVNDYFIVDKPDPAKFSPCTKFSDTQKSDIQNSDILISDIQKQDTNINSLIINNTKNNNTPIIHSSKASEGRNDRDIIYDIQKINGIPAYVLENSENLEKAIYYLCDYKKYSDSSVHDDSPFMSASFKYDSYMLFVDALMSLLSDPRKKEYNGMLLTRLNLIKRINRYCTEMMDGRVSIHPLIESAQHQYLKASKITIPKYPIKFMQHMIINSLVEGEIETDAQIIHNFKDNQSSLGIAKVFRGNP